MPGEEIRSLPAEAFALARRWCAGHQVAGGPALDHVGEVVRLLRRHVFTVTSEVEAAAWLHDCHDHAPPGTDVDTVLRHLSPQVTEIVAAVRHERVSGQPPADIRPLLISAAAKIVNLRTVLDRRWCERPEVVAALAYIRSFWQVTNGRLPPAMADELAGLFERVGRNRGLPEPPAPARPPRRS